MLVCVCDLCLSLSHERCETFTQDSQILVHEKGVEVACPLEFHRTNAIQIGPLQVNYIVIVAAAWLLRGQRSRAVEIYFVLSWHLLAPVNAHLTALDQNIARYNTFLQTFHLEQHED